MSLDGAALAAALAAQGSVARVVVAEAKGSVPRGPGTEMLVWANGFSGTIGGGALEWRALALAREVLTSGQTRVLRLPLGPGLGQCCGGAVTLVIERVSEVPALPWMRQVEGDRAAPVLDSFGLRDGWLWEDTKPQGAPVFIWGGGHVGAALARVLAPLDGLAVTCADTSDGRMPDLPDPVAPLLAEDLPRALALGPREAFHVILTHSHDLDLALCHGALTHGFRWCGLIGSATKWARFRKRLGQMGHGAAEIARITCPIGAPHLGKEPQAIAIGVANGLLTMLSKTTPRAG